MKISIASIKRLTVCALALISALTANPVAAQTSAASDYPNRPIKLVLGFPPAGSGDFLGRLVAEEISKAVGQSVVVENKPGAATNIASDLVAKANPDGYTLLLGGSFSHSVNPHLFAKLPFDAAKDFTPIAKVATSPTVIVVPASLPVSTLAEFLALAKKQGDKMMYASSGIASPGHIAGSYLNKSAELSMTHVPYKGAGESVRALVAGEVQMIVTSPPSVMGFIKDGRLKPLALTSAKSSSLLPNIPGAQEAGLKNFDVTGWYGLYGPAGLPPAIASKLHAAVNSAMNSAAVRERIQGQGMTPHTLPSAQAFAEFGDTDRRAYAAIVRDSGVKLDQ
ncbi:MAG: Bug family tripartite tricarboxylate transporter substrate binding protein [Casimicrobium sp.]